MNIESPNITQANPAKNNVQNQNTNNSSVKFSDELNELEKNAEKESPKTDEIISAQKTDEKTEKLTSFEQEENDVNNAVSGLNNIVEELNKKVDCSEDKLQSMLKDKNISADNNGNMINNDYNIQDNKDILPQMHPGMNFSGDGQPFSSFMNNTQNDLNQNLSMSEKDLAEESAILSSMAENIALVNKNRLSAGLKSDDNVFKYDSIIMNRADVELFANLVEQGTADMSKLSPDAAKRTVQVSKTLADLLAKSMANNKPLRIDFDNNISVIIKISREGKISADFLPSSQVAEAYLKENLPLLRPRFDENNIEYDELNQRNSREQERQDKKKERDNE